MIRASLIGIIVTAVALARGVAIAQFTPPPRTFATWVNAGDPRAVPVIVSRLHEAAGRPAASMMERAFLGDMLRTAARFQLDEFGPTLAAFARRGDLSETDLETVAEAAAAYDADAASPLQRAILAIPRFVQPEGRVRLLSTLAEHGDDRAADALADWTLAEFRRIEPLGPEHGEASNALWQDVPRTRSTRLLERLRAQPPLASEFGRSLQTDLIARCAAAQRSLDALYAALPHATPATRMQAADALAVIAKIGTADDVDRLARCPIGVDNAMDADRLISDARTTAVGELRRRHWRDAGAAIETTQATTRSVE